MKLFRVGQHLILVALPLLILGGASKARAADNEMAPRGWLDPHTHHRLQTVNGYRHGPAVYGWSTALAVTCCQRPTAGTDVAGWSYRARGDVLPATNSWNGCGFYHYWNGEQCVDARDIAPSQ